MTVRAYDPDRRVYFKSEVYAVIHVGWCEKQLLFVPCEDGDYLKLFDHLDTTQSPAPVLTNIIRSERPSGWIVRMAGSSAETFEGLLPPDIDTKIYSFIGFEWIFDRKDVVAKLLQGERIPLVGSIFEGKTYSDIESGWNYVETQESIDYLMDETCDFHDSIIKSMSYVSGGYVDSDNSMYPINDVRTLGVRFDSQSSGPFEMIFEGLIALNLRPVGDNYTADIFSASVHVDNGIVSFCDDSVDFFDSSYDGTWMTAYSLRWRFL